MKRKLTINTLALGNLSQRKKQYTILIVGVILAMIFSSGTMFFVSCTKASNEEFRRRRLGNFYGYYFACEDFVDVVQGVKDGLVESYGYAHVLGYAYTDKEKIDRGTPVAWLDESAKELYYVHFVEGRYPEKKGEIAIEETAALRLGIKPAVGEKISLSLLTANYTDFLDTSVKKTYTVVGILSDKRKNLENFESVEFPAAFVCDEETVALGGKEIPAVFFNPTEKALKKTFKTKLPSGMVFHESLFFVNFISPIYDKAAAVYGENYDNINFIYDVKSLDRNTSASVMNSAILSITLAAVLMIASFIGIVNAFSANLKDRKMQIGMLRAVGATKRQIINIFGREAFFISLICAPIGVAVSYFGVKLYARLMGDEFIFMPNFGVLVISALAGVVCVMLAALIPLASASKISPMQAIRNVELGRKMKRKKIKSQKSFVVPRLLASRSLSFYKGRQVGVAVILVITIFLSSFGFALLKSEFSNSAWSNFNTSDYIVTRRDYPNRDWRINMPNVDKRINSNTIRDVLDYPMFKSVYGCKEAETALVCEKLPDYVNLVSIFDFSSFRFDDSHDSELKTKENLQNAETVDRLLEIWYTGESEFYQKLRQSIGTSSDMTCVKIQGYDPIMIENNLERFKIIDGKINLEKLESGEEIILVAYNEASFNIRWDNENNSIYSYGMKDAEEPYEYDRIKNTEEISCVSAKLDYKVGDTLELRTLYSNVSDYDGDDYSYINRSNLTVFDKKVKIGAIVKPFVFSETMSNHNKFGIVTTSAGIDVITGKQQDYEQLNIDYDGEIDDEADLEATEYLNGIFSGGCYSAQSGHKYDKDSREMSRILMISLLSVVILLFSVCASIVNNALTAKIREGKREIGTLRAVGASLGELTEAYIRQFISMFIWGMGIGLGGYTVSHVVAKLWFKESYSLPFFIWPSLIICLLLCLICSANLYSKIKREMKHSIVENIREL